MRNILPILVILLLAVGCTSTPNDFQTYLKQIEPIPTPIRFSVFGYTANIMKATPDSSLFDKFKYVYANEVFGKIYENEKSIGIIYTVYGDALTPVLVTYDKLGNKIDSMSMFDNASGYDPEQETYVSVTLNPDQTIHEIDSTMTWTLNDKGTDRIENSGQLTVDSIQYKVTEDGKIHRQLK